MAGSTPARRDSQRPVSDGHQSTRPGSRDMSTAGTPASVPTGSTASSDGRGHAHGLGDVKRPCLPLGDMLVRPR